MMRRCFVTVTLAAVAGVPLGVGFLVALLWWVCDGTSLDGIF